MNVWRMIIRELRCRFGGFVVAVLSVGIPSGCLVGTLALIHQHDTETVRILTQQEENLAQRVAGMSEDVKRAMKHLGFNITILPSAQDLAQWHDQGAANVFMPQAYAAELARSELLTIEHIVPAIRYRAKWPERKWTVLFSALHSTVVKPAADGSGADLPNIPPGHVRLGAELHQGLSLSEGQPIAIMGHTFTVDACLPEQGNRDDVTVSFHLKDLQKLLDRDGMITEIRALECRCAWTDVDQVRKEVGHILPETRVVEHRSVALAKAKARTDVAEQGKQAIKQEALKRQELRHARLRFGAILVAFVSFGSVVWAGLVSLINARSRRAEIGVLRTLGFRTGQVLMLFLGRAAFVGLSGGVLGGALGLAVTTELLQNDGATGMDGLLWTWAAGLLLAVCVSLVAGAVPAVWAAQQHPADMVRE